MLLVVYFISFFLVYHHTGECIVRIIERTRSYQPIFNLRFSCEHKMLIVVLTRILKKRTTRSK